MNTPWLGWNLEEAEAAFTAAFVPKPASISADYRGWRIVATDHAATATKSDGSGERFECHRQPGIDEALRAARRKVDRLEGPAVWDENYQDEELKK